MSDHPDSDLLTNWCAGDRDAYAVLVSRHYGLVEAACRRQAPSGEAEDCAQAVFLILARKPSAAARAPALQAWLVRVAWFVCEHARRAAGRRRQAEENARATTTVADSTPLSESSEALVHLDGCLLKLPEQQRVAVTLHYLAGRTPDEVATTLGITRNHTYQLLSRGLAGLRVLLARRGVAVAQVSLIGVLAGEAHAAGNSPPIAMLFSLAGTPATAANAHAYGAMTSMKIAAFTAFAPIAAVAGLLLMGGVLTLALTAEAVPPVKPLAVADTPAAAKPAAAKPAAITPAQWLAAQPKPAFKSGHTLPRLTRYGWECMPLATGKPLAEDWGYALEFTRYVTDMDAVARIDVPGSREAETVALVLAKPHIYKLNVTTTQTIPTDKAPPGAFTRDAAGTIMSGQGVSADGTTWGGAGPLISLEAPDALWIAAAELRVAPLRALVARGIPIDSIHNGGESGLGIPGFADAVWNKDPAIGAAVGASVWGLGSMYDHASAKKGNSELIIAAITKAAVPGRSFFNYYAAGGGTVRNKDWAVDAWGPRWHHTRGTCDFPSNEIYYDTKSFTGHLDALTAALNATSLEIATGDTLSYNWISGGWDGKVADIRRWTGFLKCYYTVGMIGANTGKYGNFTQGEYEAPFPADKPPVWLPQLVATSYVHALFSQLEDVLRNGDLLPGPARHAVSPDEPAYEFPTGDDTARVVVRKHRTQPVWLITAWAADGADRKVPIYVPELGQLTVEARIVGSVYKATLDKAKVTLIRQDDEGATYSAVAPGTPVVTPVNFTIPLPAKDRLLWLVADSGVTADAAGKVSAWASQGGNIKVTQPDAARRPTLAAKAVNGKPAIRFANTWLANMDLGVQGDAFIGPLTVYAVFTGGDLSTRGSVAMAIVPNGNPWADGQGFAIANNPAENSQVTQGIVLKTAPYVSATTRLQKLIIGENDSPGSGFGHTGDLAELLVYKGLSPLSQERVRLYLETKYGISRHTTLVNGDFENPVAKGGFQYAPCPGTTHSRGAQGWFFASLAAIQANGSGWSDAIAPSGKQTAVLQGSAGRLGSISQMVHLAAGTYTMGFKAARCKGQIQPLKFSVDQIQIGSLLTPAGTAFQPLTTGRFTVAEGLHLLRFEASDGTGGTGDKSDKSTLLDEVILQSVNAAKTPGAGR